MVNRNKSKPCVIFIANRGYALTNSRTGLIRKFIENNWQVVLATSRDTESLSLCKFGANLEILNINRNAFSFFDDIAAFKRILEIFNKWEPVLVHQFHAKPVIIGSIAAKYCSNKPVIVNTITGLGNAFVAGGVVGYVAGLGYKYSLPNANMTIFQNNDDHSFFLLKKWISRQKSCLIPGSGIDIQRFQVARKLSHISSEGTIVMLGRLLRQKGVEEFVDVASYIHKKWPKMRFFWAGEEDLEHSNAVDAEWFRSQSDVEYLGRLDDVIPLFEQADLLLFTSYYREGVPRVILEASAMSLPTVGFDVPGVREAVQHRQTGFLVPQGDLKGMADLVMLLLKNTEMRRVMGKNARNMVENNFDIDTIQEYYLQVYRNLGVEI